MSLKRVVVVLAALVAVTACASSQRLSAPATALMDETLAIRATGLQPGQRVKLRATMRDSTLREWRAEGVFVTGASGDVIPARDSSIAGSYSGVDAMGLVTSMDLTEQPGSGVYLTPLSGDIPLHVALEVDGRVADSTTILRRFLSPGVRTLSLGGDAAGLVGTLFLPAQTRRAPGVLVLGGSEGGNSAEDVAAQLAARGYVALSIAYFAAPSLPTELDEVPLEYFSRAVAYLIARPEVDSTSIALFGSSKGAEAALWIAAQDPRVRAVIAYAPSSVIWSCICSRTDHSSWSVQGQGVPNVPPGRDPNAVPVPGQPFRPAVNYRYRLRDAAAVAAAIIPVERIRGPVLLVAGGADEMWPSADMARQVRARLASVRRPPGDSLLVYPNAGHRIGKSFLPAGSTRVAGGRLETGGTPRANALAQREAWAAVLHFLARALRN